MAKNKKVLAGNFKKERVVKPAHRRQIDAKYWREIIASPAKAKEALIHLETPQGRVTKVNLANGNKIDVQDVTEQQAHEFMCMLCPEWALTKPEGQAE